MVIGVKKKPMMTYHTIQPSAKLAPYIRYFWVLEGSLQNDQLYTHRSMATGCPELVFHYKGRFNQLMSNGETASSYPSGIDGPSQTFRRYSTTENFGIFGAYLYPFAIPALFTMPASELINLAPDLHTLAGQEGKDLEEKMMLAPSTAERIKILSAFIEKKLAQRESVQPAVFSSIYSIIQSNGAVRVDNLARQSFLSTRQFERTFKKYAGFSPKLFSRITRFQSALLEYGQTHKTLTSIAYQCGYFDQAHFIHDFKEFSGYHPKEYFSGHAEGTEWRA
jgi:AraC-like DNA-binding protein